MTVTQKIRMALAYRNISEAELARRIGTSPSAFNQRMKTGKFSDSDLTKIANALNAKFNCSFVFDDGTTV